MQELDPAKPLVLLIGDIPGTDVENALRVTGRQFKIKRLESRVENWDTISTLLETFDVRCAVVKLTGRTFEFLVRPEYEAPGERFLTALARVQHVVFMHESLISEQFARANESPEHPAHLPPDFDPSDFDLDPELFGVRAPIFHNPSPEVRAAVWRLLERHSLDVLPYSRNAELSVMAAAVIADSERGLMFRVYIPHGRIWQEETGRLLQLFRDYLSRVGYAGVHLAEHRTEFGTNYEFCCTPRDSQAPPAGPGSTSCVPTLASEFEDFSTLLDLSVTNPNQADALLRAKQVDPREIAAVLTKYAKEAKRLHVDARQERERKVLSIRHRLESELVDLLPPSAKSDMVATLVESAVPAVPRGPAGLLTSVAPTIAVSDISGGQVTLNVSTQVQNAVNSVVRQELEGHATLTQEDRQILEVIREHGGSQAPALASAIQELADPSTPAPRRRLGVQLLKSFLAKAASKLGDVATSILTRYLERQLGL